MIEKWIYCKYIEKPIGFNIYFCGIENGTKRTLCEIDECEDYECLKTNDLK